MASARELLEQADALMRRNRSRSGADIPVLTDVVAAATRDEPSGADVPVLTDVVKAGAERRAIAEDAVPAAVPVPLETPAVAAQAAAAPAVVVTRDEGAAIMHSLEAVPVELPMEGDMSDWLVMDTIDPSTHSITGVAPDTLAVLPPVTLKAPASDPTPPPEGALADAAPAPVPEPPPAVPAPTAEEVAAREARAAAEAEAARAAAAAVEDERWRALAEQVSMQVLQRVDLFTDTGLKTQLAQHLQPIVERASAELVSAITEHVGRLLRTYVAEAIEREIAQWRREH